MGHIGDERFMYKGYIGQGEERARETLPQFCKRSAFPRRTGSKRSRSSPMAPRTLGAASGGPVPVGGVQVTGANI